MGGTQLVLSNCLLWEPHRQQVHQVLVGLQGRGHLLQLDQLIDMIVKGQQLVDVDLPILQIVGHGFVQGDEVLEVHPQDGDLELGALPIGSPVVVIVSTGGQQLRHLTQNLQNRRDPVTGTHQAGCVVRNTLSPSQHFTPSRPGRAGGDLSKSCRL